MNVQIQLPVSNIMTTNLITLDVKESLDKAEHLFKKYKIRHIPVIENEKIIGMISLNDILRISFADGAYREEENISSSIYEMFTIRQLMIGNLETVSPDTTIKEVAELLVKREFHSLPVVEKGKLKGMVTTTDLIKYLLKQC
ncbi:MAG: CBS domain-containing protein [Eudoraea sp.]|jgi:CBS domain-containing protein|uniref:CBS domain-containing protein n=1 Tax=Eudoraea sp. TaxID=1979955 RepID=UPI0026275197|nr:CBS domain-containing protein [uncultured Eudoraea sp.]